MVLRNFWAFIFFLGLISLGLCQADPPPNTLVGDTFTLNSGDRQAGKRLGHLPSEIGQVTWIATDHLTFTDRGTITSNTVNPVVGSLPLPSFSKTLTVQADFILEGSAYVALAFADNGDPNSFWSATKILATLSKNGRYNIFADGVKIKVANGTLKSPPPSGQMTHLELSYDPVDNKVSLAVNGERVVDQIPLAPYTPKITYACFRFQNPVVVNLPEVDNFFVSEQK